ncbi:hypothetical protein AHF37_01483 [Paragonimus kellicotti]|nr:hypothetical protein AHF37_01483 [Paragonimus kellicotti]
MGKRELYKATCLSELDKLISVPAQFSSAQEVLKIMSECFRRAGAYQDQDEEAAYILFRRYFDFYDQLKKLSGNKLITSGGLKKQLSVAINCLETLHGNLKRRYDELNSARSTSIRLPSPPREDPKFHDPVGCPKTEVAGNNQGWISVEELANLIKKKRNVLVFDVRTEQEFSSCRMKVKALINVPADKYLDNSVTFSRLSSQLSDGVFKDLWNMRGGFDVIVLMDQSAGHSLSDKPVSCCLNRLHPLLTLKDALYKWDAQHVVKVEPRILAGGMQEFLLRYAPLTTNPEVRALMTNMVMDGRSSLLEGLKQLVPVKLVPEQLQHVFSTVFPGSELTVNYHEVIRNPKETIISSPSADENLPSTAETVVSSVSGTVLPSSTFLSNVTPSPLSTPVSTMDKHAFGAVESQPQFPSCQPRPCGLRNLGNTCYMNVVLQALAHTSLLTTFYLRGLDNAFTNAENPLGYGGRLSAHFQRLFTGMWSKLDCFDELSQFKGQLLSTVRCCSCPKVSFKFDTFMCLSLTVPGVACDLQVFSSEFT